MPVRVPVQLLALVLSGSGLGVALQHLQTSPPPPAPEIVRAEAPVAEAVPLLRPLRDCSLLTAAANGAVALTQSHLESAAARVVAAEPGLTAAVFHVRDLRTDEIFELASTHAAIPLEALKLPRTLAAAQSPTADLQATLAALELHPTEGRLTTAQALRPWTVLYNATLLDAAASEALLMRLPATRTPAVPTATVIEERSVWSGGAATCGLVYGPQQVHARCVSVLGEAGAPVEAALDRLLAHVDAEMAVFRVTPDAQASR